MRLRAFGRKSTFPPRTLVAALAIRARIFAGFKHPGSVLWPHSPVHSVVFPFLNAGGKNAYPSTRDPGAANLCPYPTRRTMWWPVADLRRWLSRRPAVGVVRATDFTCPAGAQILLSTAWPFIHRGSWRSYRCVVCRIYAGNPAPTVVSALAIPFLTCAERLATLSRWHVFAARSGHAKAAKAPVPSIREATNSILCQSEILRFSHFFFYRKFPARHRLMRFCLSSFVRGIFLASGRLSAPGRFIFPLLTSENPATSVRREAVPS